MPHFDEQNPQRSLQVFLNGLWGNLQHLNQLKTQGFWVLFIGKLSYFTNLKLVGHLPSEKNEFVSWDDYYQLNGKRKMFQTTNQLSYFTNLRLRLFLDDIGRVFPYLPSFQRDRKVLIICPVFMAENFRLWTFTTIKIHTVDGPVKS